MSNLKLQPKFFYFKNVGSLFFITVLICIIINEHIFRHLEPILFTFWSLCCIAFFFLYAKIQHVVGYRYVQFELNDKGIKSRSDFVGIHETRIKYVDIKQVELRQGPIQRLYGIGSVSVTTHATTSNAGIELYDIKEYQEVYEFLLKKIQHKQY